MSSKTREADMEALISASDRSWPGEWAMGLTLLSPAGRGGLLCQGRPGPSVHGQAQGVKVRSLQAGTEQRARKWAVC